MSYAAALSTPELNEKVFDRPSPASLTLPPPAHGHFVEIVFSCEFVFQHKDQSREAGKTRAGPLLTLEDGSQKSVLECGDIEDAGTAHGASC